MRPLQALSLPTHCATSALLLRIKSIASRASNGASNSRLRRELGRPQHACQVTTRPQLTPPRRHHNPRVGGSSPSSGIACLPDLRDRRNSDPAAANSLKAMISWGTILYGAALTLVLVAVVLRFVAQARTATVVAGALAAALSAIAWNAILHHTGGEFFVDAPIVVFPVSWQDTGTGVFALAGVSLALGLGPERSSQTGTSTRLALIGAAAAFAVDIYLY